MRLTTAQKALWVAAGAAALAWGGWLAFGAPRPPGGLAAATVEAVRAVGGQIEWEEVPAGLAAIESDKDPLPPRTLEAITRHQLALKGPLGTPSGGGFRSVNVTLRQHFDLYANVRPAKTIPGAVRNSAAGLASPGADHGGSAVATGAARSSVRAARTATRTGQGTGATGRGCGI